MIETLLDACPFVLEFQGEPQSSYWLASQITEMKLWRASEAKVEGRLIEVPLAECEAKKGSPNRQVLKDYSYWFWSNR
jgi:hypothetical protein